MSRTRLALAAALLAASLPALAQDAKSPAAPAPAAKPAAAPAARPQATELARVLMPKTTWTAGLDQLGQMTLMRLSSHPGSQPIEYPKDMQAKVKAELEGALPYDALVGLHAKELGATFSDAELGELLAFYRSPIGQKALAKMGEVQNSVGLETQKRIEGKMPDIMKRLSSLGKVKPAPEGAKKKDAPAGQKPAGHP